MPRPQTRKFSSVAGVMPLPLSSPAVPVGTAPVPAHYRKTKALWLALKILDPLPDLPALESLAGFALSLTPAVVIEPEEGLLLEVRGSLKYFSGMSAIREHLSRELERRAWTFRLATAPTPLAALWLVRCKSVEVTDERRLAGAIGSLPLAATAWPRDVLGMLGQMGLSSIADCLRLPRAGFARRIGQERLDDLDRALGRLPDCRDLWEAPERLFRTVDFTTETMDQAVFADALGDIAGVFEQELRRRQMQLQTLTLDFRHLRSSPSVTHLRFVDPVHDRERMLGPLLARIERMSLAGPAIGLSLETGTLKPLEADAPRLLLPPGVSANRAVPEFALIESLRGRFGVRRVHGIDWVAEHRPERAWRRWVDRPVSGSKAAPACPPQGRPLWLLPKPKKNRGQSPDSDPDFSDPERIESGWWDNADVRRDYHVVTGTAGERLWFFRDCQTDEWYLHGIFG